MCCSPLDVLSTLFRMPQARDVAAVAGGASVDVDACEDPSATCAGIRVLPTQHACGVWVIFTEQLNKQSHTHAASRAKSPLRPREKDRKNQCPLGRAPRTRRTAAAGSATPCGNRPAYAALCVCAANPNRRMLQLLLTEGAISETDLLEHLGDCVERHKAEAKRAKVAYKHEAERDIKTLRGIVDDINSQIEAWNMKIARKNFKAPGSSKWVHHYGVVNILEDDGMCKQDWLSKSEQEFFHLIVAEILDADTKSIDSTIAIPRPRPHDDDQAQPEQGSDASIASRRGSGSPRTRMGSYALGVRTELQRLYWSADPGTEGNVIGGGSAPWGGPGAAAAGRVVRGAGADPPTERRG